MNSKKLRELIRKENKPLTDEHKRQITEVWNNLYESIFKDEDNFETKITYISAGGIGLLLAYISSSGNNEYFHWGLLLGLTCFILALSLNMVLYLISKRWKRNDIKRYERYLKREKGCGVNPNRDSVTLSKRIDRWNWLTMVLLLLGIIFSSFYVCSNIINL